MFVGVAGRALDPALRSRFADACRRHPRASKWHHSIQSSDNFVLLADSVERLPPGPAGAGSEHVVAISGAPVGSTPPYAPGKGSDVLATPSGFDGPFVGVAIRKQPGSVWLVRDKHGFRTLLYRVENGRIWFSDDAGLLAALLGGVRARGYALAEWCHFGVCLAPRSMFDVVGALGPGERLSFNPETGAVSVDRYFRIEDLVDKDYYREVSSRSVPDLEAELERRLERSVRSFRAGRERVEILLSGGVDSSLLSAVAARHGAVRTLTVQIMSPPLMPELDHAKAVAAHLGLPNEVVEFSATDFRAQLVDTVFAQGTPVLLENGLALNKLARDGHIAPGQRFLDGEGADALFAGSTSLFRYDYALLKLASVSFSPPGAWAGRLGYLRRSAERLGITTWAPWEPYGLHEILGSGRLGTEHLQAQLLERYGFIDDPVERSMCALMLGEFFMALRPCFHRLEAAGRVAGADVCLPFLTEDLMRFAFNLPLRYKLHTGRLLKMPETKWLLKRIAAKHVPPRVVYRPKDGFEVPGAQWLGDWPAAWIADSWLAEHLGLDRDSLKWWLETNRLSRDRFYLTSMEVWGRLFERGQALDEVRTQWLAS